MTEQEFEGMVRQYGRLVFTVCNQLVGDAALAEDLAQEAFLSAWLNADSCPAGARRAWLCRIAANKAKDHLKSAYHRRVQAVEEPGAQQPGGDLPSPCQLCEGRETLERVKNSIFGLRAPYREVSALFFLGNYSVAEIARLLGRPHKTVNTQLYRARRLLQASLGPAAA